MFWLKSVAPCSNWQAITTITDGNDWQATTTITDGNDITDGTDWQATTTITGGYEPNVELESVASQAATKRPRLVKLEDVTNATDAPTQQGLRESATEVRETLRPGSRHFIRSSFNRPPW